jgi:uncharacterized membrane protein YfcA
MNNEFVQSKVRWIGCRDVDLSRLLFWLRNQIIILIFHSLSASSFFISKFGRYLNIPALYTKYSFRVAIMLVLLLAVMITVSIVWATPRTGGLMIPPILFMIFAGSITGSYFAIKSFKEKMDYRKLIGIIVNFGMVSLVISLFFSKMIEIS